jgi:hypothetical protein
VNILEQIIENFYEEEFLKANGFDDAVLGLEENEMRLIYSVSKCIEILKIEMSTDDALEHFTYNVSGAYVGKKTPIWCWDIF